MLVKSCVQIHTVHRAVICLCQYEIKECCQCQMWLEFIQVLPCCRSVHFKAAHRPYYFTIQKKAGQNKLSKGKTFSSHLRNTMLVIKLHGGISPRGSGNSKTRRTSALYQCLPLLPQRSSFTLSNKVSETNRCLSLFIKQKTVTSRMFLLCLVPGHRRWGGGGLGCYIRESFLKPSPSGVRSHSSQTHSGWRITLGGK